MSRYRPLTAAAKAGAAALAATALVVASAGLASAHVTIGPDATPKYGADVELTFRVPNEEATADTTQVEVAFPTDHPITGVLAESTPGWKATVTDTSLPTPITTDDGTITQVVSKIAWTGGTVTPGQYQGFRVLLGKLPGDTDHLVFKAVQTYSNGDVVRWIDLGQPGQPTPEHPAPVLVLTSPGTAVANRADSDSTARTMGAVGILVGAAGLATGAYGVAMGRRKRSIPAP